MEKQSTQINSALRRWFFLCPIRHILLLLSGLLIAGYFAFKGHMGIMTWLCEHITRPWHSFCGKLCSGFGFSVAALLIAALIIGLLAYTVLFFINVVRRGERFARIYRFIVSLVTVAAAVYAGFCLLWGVYYCTSDFEEQSGIKASPVSVQQLESVTAYFAKLANDYGEQVARDSEGIFAQELSSVFESSVGLYRNVEKLYPCLAGPELKAKPFMFSKAMSYISFTGFFFPFTGEANINVDSPSCLVPSTIAHEIAHQRGVAQEDEANFAAVLASLESGDPVYCYSACLLAYIHLGNALYEADYDAWARVYSSLSDGVRADLTFNNEYWSKFETPVSDASDAVYTGFLQSYGQTLGLKTYGACVDLLVAYYYDISIKE